MDRTEIQKLADMTQNLGGQFVLPDFDVRQYSPLTLAYIGDAIYELVIRTLLVRKNNEAVNRLHRKAASLVKAETQSAMMAVYEEKGILTEEEAGVFRRGRNAKANTHAKNASIQEYRRATGFEAVLGYLYMKGDLPRIMELVSLGLGELQDRDTNNHSGIQ